MAPGETGNQVNGYNFSGEKRGALYEKVYFKSAGDKATSNTEFFDQAGGYDAVTFNLRGDQLTAAIKDKDQNFRNGIPRKRDGERAARSRVFSYLTAEHADQLALDDIRSTSGRFFSGSLTSTTIPRIDANKKAHHLSEITHNQS